MPFVNVTVNVELTGDQRCVLLEAVHSAIKSALGKPDSYIAVNLNISKSFIFGKTPDPCAMVQVQAVGPGGQSLASAEVTKALEKVGIPGDRVFVNFQSFSPKDWAMGGLTFG